MLLNQAITLHAKLNYLSFFACAFGLSFEEQRRIVLILAKHALRVERRRVKFGDSNHD